MADRNKQLGLITVTIKFPDEEQEWGAAEHFIPDEMDLYEIFEGLRCAFERAFEKDKNEAG